MEQQTAEYIVYGFAAAKFLALCFLFGHSWWTNRRIRRELRQGRDEINRIYQKD